MNFVIHYFCAKNRTFAFWMQTADLIFISISALVVDVYNILLLIVIAYLYKWPVKILAKMSLKLCMVL